MMTQASYHVAQMNWGILRADWDDPQVAEFADNLDLVNGVAERAPGFVWRMSDDDMDAAQNDATGIFDGNVRMASTMSVWENNADLENFVHNTIHGAFMKKRAQWFEAADKPRYVIWPVAKGHIPSLTEAKEKLDLLTAQGSSEDAYDFKYLSQERSQTEAV